jgi:hypothetical protein
MALVLKDRVKETTTTTGTGTITLLGAATGFQSFSAIGNANTTYYTIAGQTGSEWEVGIGTYTASGTTLSRAAVLSSSNSGSLVTFSAGTKDVFVTYPAGYAATNTATGTLALVAGGSANGATGAYSTVGGGYGNLASGSAVSILGGESNTASSTHTAIGGGYQNNASAQFATVAGGWNNAASGLASACIGGLDGVASGVYSSVVGGASSTASGTYSATLGGNAALANAVNSIVLGGTVATSRSIVGNTVVGACSVPINISPVGVHQTAVLVIAVQTTNATATVLKSDVNAAGTTNQVILPNNSAYYFNGSIIAGVTGAGNTAAWSFEGAIKRGANAAATSIVQSVVNLVAQDAGASTWVVAIAADTTNGGLKITVTGQATTTIRWVAKVQTTEMTY